MAEIIPQRELRNDNAAIVDRVAQGQTFVVTRHGRPVAELRPVGRGRGHLVARADLAAVAARSEHIDSTAFRADLDVVLNPEIDR
ncbi:MAG TPA: type II toxin-antitoxin system prevent-host-death family antitoxin [Candidatus Nitrosotalea sp.]|nr:type II toxin-antitoxin system prevent-host-death family antitoxin [Candidatus Nitrosotalea sp.]